MRKSNRDIVGGGDRGVLSSFVEMIVGFIEWVLDLLYVPPIRRYISKERFRYFSCGAGNYIVLDSLLYFVVYHYIVGVQYFDVGVLVISPHVLSLMIVFPITFFTGFFLNRYVVFDSTSRKLKFQIARYAITVAGSIILNYVIIKFLVEYANIWATPSKVICSLVTAIYSYFMARYFTFVDDRKKVAGSSCVQTK